MRVSYDGHCNQVEIRSLLFDFRQVRINVNSARLRKIAPKSEQEALWALRGEFDLISWPAK